ncbi:hypothetical protein NM208_g9151 [Fusarium decemcellulare]|uniref:Uncharacterized protein n=1 Tax=Fusarium decemcellulare TaxID=57161 RepID=A0ACC1S2P2_9HYPO|nr:hypothetical protein NM208_g9151 [Fusarium decemcellulare]
MKTSLLILDPKGDTELILRRPNLNQDGKEEKPGVEDSSEATDGEPQTHKTRTDVFCDRSASIHTLAEIRELRPCDDNNQSIEVRFRVSSPHLILTSPVFKAMLDGPFSEGVRNERGFYEIKAFEWSAEALLILLDIIHGHHRNTPKTVDISLLEQVAVLVDYYQCHEIVEVFADKWMAAHQDAFPKDYGKPCMSWMFFAWEPSNAHLEKLESRRQFLINQVIDNVYGMLESLWATNDGCSVECSCMLLGSLMKQMRANGLQIPRPAGWTGQEKTVIEWRQFINALNSPAWRPDTPFGTSAKHECTFKDKTLPWMEDMARTYMSGIEFEDFRSVKVSPNDAPSLEPK